MRENKSDMEEWGRGIRMGWMGDGEMEGGRKDGRERERDRKEEGRDTDREAYLAVHLGFPRLDIVWN